MYAIPLAGWWISLVWQATQAFPEGAETTCLSGFDPELSLPKLLSPDYSGSQLAHALTVMS